MTTKDVINGVRADQYAEEFGNVPLYVFPKVIQEIILEVMKFDDFKIEYLIACLLSAAATAIGNSFRVHIKGSWYSAPSFYFILVGRPGLGKSHPIDWAYQYLYHLDEEESKRFKEEDEAFELAVKTAEKNAPTPAHPKPAVYNIMNDFTTEAIMKIHSINARGVCIVTDEIASLFKTMGRYSSGKSDLIEKLLTAYSGKRLFTDRVTNSYRTYVKSPCINLIGTIQTDLVKKYLMGENEANGLTDRFIFVFPHNKKMKNWTEDLGIRNYDATNKWNSIVKKLREVESLYDEFGNVTPRTLNMDQDASARFFVNHNEKVVAVNNAIDNDCLLDNERYKMDDKVARLALIIQLIRWAAGEGSNEVIDLQSIESAIKLIDFFSDGYHSLKESIVVVEKEERSKILYENLPPGEFGTSTALAIASGLSISERSTYDYLERLCKSGLLTKTGERRSVKYTKPAAAVCSNSK